MTKIERDRPKLIVFPPLLLFATIGSAAVLQWLWPLDVLGGLVLASLALAVLLRARTPAPGPLPTS